jgi:hypothetical protein
VLAPLCDLEQVTFPPRLATVEALRALWRSQLHALRAAAWGPVQRPLDFAYAANCPPHSFARDGSGHRPCNKPRVCPFCHGIHASLLFENVRRAVRRQSPPVDLYILVKTCDCQTDRLGEALDALKRYDHALLRERAQQSGVVARTTLSPAKDGADKVLVRHAALVAVPAGARVPAEVAKRGRKVRQDDLSLAFTVGKLARYPAGLLCGPAGATARLLEATAGRHLGHAVGVFRSPRSAVAIEQCRGQRLAPALRRPLPHYRLAEEEKIISCVEDDGRQYERLALRSLLARLGLPARGDTFAGANSLPVPMAWLGRLQLGSMKEFLKPPKHLRDVFRPFRKQGDHALVFLAPGLGFVACSTVGLDRAGLAEGHTVAQRYFGGRPYTIEALGQFGERLRSFRPAPCGVGAACAAG